MRVFLLGAVVLVLGCSGLSQQRVASLKEFESEVKGQQMIEEARDRTLADVGRCTVSPEFRREMAVCANPNREVEKAVDAVREARQKVYGHPEYNTADGQCIVQLVGIKSDTKNCYTGQHGFTKLR